jgi:8-oxo-dGTP pyrophosphatase MutT (NUDIX family)
VPAWFDEVAERVASRPAARIPEPGSLRPAAVLVPLQVQAGEIWVILIRRSEALPRHAGQYEFPGGAREEGDEDEVANALRSAGEALGIPAEAVMVLGHLDEIGTSSGLAVAPVVGALPSDVEPRPTGGEVAAVVRAPLRYLASPELVEEQEEVHRGVRVLSPVFHYRGLRIAGATARILADLLARLGLMAG